MKFMKNFCSDTTQVKQCDLWIFSDPVGSDPVYVGILVPEFRTGTAEKIRSNPADSDLPIIQDSLVSYHWKTQKNIDISRK